eukprot:TRINITY_DN29378_c0_g1_i1.p1 TRINITY_DN29378_c0_g1~~TRINITY_DN29378_c0_g1_i1.p1  ORF type:complete len:1409 (+),score=223.81 TRINITY_DN29378_c0_g1_i1:249-4475(+)
MAGVWGIGLRGRQSTEGGGKGEVRLEGRTVASEGRASGRDLRGMRERRGQEDGGGFGGQVGERQVAEIIGEGSGGGRGGGLRDEGGEDGGQGLQEGHVDEGSGAGLPFLGLGDDSGWGDASGEIGMEETGRGGSGGQDEGARGGERLGWGGEGKGQHRLGGDSGRSGSGSRNGDGHPSGFREKGKGDEGWRVQVDEPQGRRKSGNYLSSATSDSGVGSISISRNYSERLGGERVSRQRWFRRSGAQALKDGPSSNGATGRSSIMDSGGSEGGRRGSGVDLGLFSKGAAWAKAVSLLLPFVISLLAGVMIIRGVFVGEVARERLAQGGKMEDLRQTLERNSTVLQGEENMWAKGRGISARRMESGPEGDGLLVQANRLTEELSGVVGDEDESHSGGNGLSALRALGPVGSTMIGEIDAETKSQEVNRSSRHVIEMQRSPQPRKAFQWWTWLRGATLVRADYVFNSTVFFLDATVRFVIVKELRDMAGNVTSILSDDIEGTASRLAGYRGKIFPDEAERALLLSQGGGWRTSHPEEGVDDGDAKRNMTKNLVLMGGRKVDSTLLLPRGPLPKWSGQLNRPQRRSRVMQRGDPFLDRARSDSTLDDDESTSRSASEAADATGASRNCVPESDLVGEYVLEGVAQTRGRWLGTGEQHKEAREADPVQPPSWCPTQAKKRWEPCVWGPGLAHALVLRKASFFIRIVGPSTRCYVRATGIGIILPLITVHANTILRVDYTPLQEGAYNLWVMCTSVVPLRSKEFPAESMYPPWRSEYLTRHSPYSLVVEKGKGLAMRGCVMCDSARVGGLPGQWIRTEVLACECGEAVLEGMEEWFVDDYVWAPRECVIPFRKRKDFVARFGGKALAIVGDESMRGHFVDLVNWLQGIGPKVLQDPDSYRYNQSSFVSTWDGWVAGFNTAPYAQDVDVVLPNPIGTGAKPSPVGMQYEEEIRGSVRRRGEASEGEEVARRGAGETEAAGRVRIAYYEADSFDRWLGVIPLLRKGLPVEARNGLPLPDSRRGQQFDALLFSSTDWILSAETLPEKYKLNPTIGKLAVNLLFRLLCRKPFKCATPFEGRLVYRSSMARFNDENFCARPDYKSPLQFGKACSIRSAVDWAFRKYFGADPSPVSSSPTPYGDIAHVDAHDVTYARPDRSIDGKIFFPRKCSVEAFQCNAKDFARDTRECCWAPNVFPHSASLTVTNMLINALWDDPKLIGTSEADGLPVGDDDAPLSSEVLNNGQATSFVMASTSEETNSAAMSTTAPSLRTALSNETGSLRESSPSLRTGQVPSTAENAQGVSGLSDMAQNQLNLDKLNPLGQRILIDAPLPSSSTLSNEEQPERTIHYVGNPELQTRLEASNDRFAYGHEKSRLRTDERAKPALEPHSFPSTSYAQRNKYIEKWRKKGQRQKARET